jgi:hypothetical protein
MEALVAASVFGPGAGWLSVAGSVLSVVALAATGCALAGTAVERGCRLLASGRGVCVAFSGVLVATGFVGLLARWALALACVAFLLALLAVALRYGQGTSLQSYLEARGGEDEPSWWPAFERGFHRHTSTPQREPNALHRAVTRPTVQSAAGQQGRAARRSRDVMTGGRS